MAYIDFASPYFATDVIVLCLKDAQERRVGGRRSAFLNALDFCAFFV